MDWEKYLKRLDQDMVLLSYSRHTRKVYGREVTYFLFFILITRFSSIIVFFQHWTSHSGKVCLQCRPMILRK